jgi:hypothetical protein
MPTVLIALLVAGNALLFAWGQGLFVNMGLPAPDHAATRANALSAPNTTNEQILNTVITHSRVANATEAGNASPTQTLDDEQGKAVDQLEAALQEAQKAAAAAAALAASSDTPPAGNTAPPSPASEPNSDARTSRVSDAPAERAIVRGDLPMTNAATLIGEPSTTCWRARTWPVDGLEGLQQALAAQPANVLWRIVANELAQRWVVVLPAGNTSLAQLRNTLERNNLSFRDSTAPLPKGFIVGTFVARDSADAMLNNLRARKLPVELIQERPATPVWELQVYAQTRSQADALLDRVRALPRYADSPLRVAACEP